MLRVCISASVCVSVCVSISVSVCVSVKVCDSAYVWLISVFIIYSQQSIKLFFRDLE